MNPPWPRRIVLTRTALLAPGKTTTSPALTSPAKTRSSTDDDNTVGVDGLHPYRERDMYGMCTTGETRRPARPTKVLGDPGTERPRQNESWASALTSCTCTSWRTRRGDGAASGPPPPALREPVVPG